MKIISASDFWNNVKKEIANKGITQKELCLLCGFNEGSFKNRISKKVYPTIDEVMLIAKTLQISIDRLAETELTPVPDDILDLAYEINALPNVYKNIVTDTVKTLSSDATEKAKEKMQSFG